MNIKTFLSGPLQVNCYVVSDDVTNKGFIVDPGGVNPQIEKYIEENKITIEYIILTHGHGDHIGGVEHYKDLYGAKLCIHKDELLLVSNAKFNHSFEMFGKKIELEPDLSVDEGDTLNIGEMLLKFIHTPGHTPGGMCILVDNSLFSGDTLFAQSVGRTDFPYSSTQSLITAIQKKLFSLPDETVVYPGHMGTTTIQQEKEYNPFV